MGYEFIPYSGSTKAADQIGGIVDPNTPASPATVIYRVYAPLFPDGQGDVGQTVDKFLTQVFPSTAVAISNFGINMADLHTKLLKDITGYINVLQNQGGAVTTENQESLTFAAIALPIQPGLAPSSNNFWVTRDDQVRSSWAPAFARLGDGTYGLYPRFGYSVKFVALQDLLQNGMPATDEDMGNVLH